MPTTPTRILMIFIKNPIPGKVKTRVGKDIGHQRTAECYKKLLAITRKAALETKAEKHLWYGDFININDDWDEGYFSKKLQHGEDLGSRMKNAFAEGIEKHQQVVIIGSDGPGISGYLLEKAFLHLNKNEVVIGPATDGGYYLLGMRNLHNLFDDIERSTPGVYAETRKKIKDLDLSCKELPELSDLDTIDDLKQFSQL